MSPDATRFEPTSILGFPQALVAEQLTRIETVSLIIRHRYEEIVTDYVG